VRACVRVCVLCVRALCACVCLCALRTRVRCVRACVCACVRACVRVDVRACVRRSGSLEDYIFSYREFGQKKIVRYASDAGISVAEYRFYHTFALDFLCYCSGTNDAISAKFFDRVITR
jgi:hypothetical protein